MKRSPEIGRIIAYFFIIVSPMAIFIAINFKTQGPFLVKIADGSALLAFAIFTMQFVLSARLQWIERPFGLDRIFRFHKLMAIVAASLLLVHPVMVAAGDEEFGWSLLFSFRLPWAVLLGKATLFTVMVTAIVGLCRRIFKIEFQKWLLSHNALAILILIAGFVHGSIVGPDLKNHVLRGYMVFFIIFAALAYGYQKIVRPFFSWLRAYRIVDVKQESPDTWTLTFAPQPDRRTTPFKPGQFHFLRLFRGKGLPREEHPFSISSSPAKPETLSSTIKNSGDFTALIPQTTIGDRAVLIGPYGRFSYLLYENPATIVLIAGGIGIAPLMSMLRHMRDTGATNNVVLIYANKTERDIVFKSELDAMLHAQIPPLKMVHVLSRPDESWQGERGHINETIIQRYCTHTLQSAAFYFCGPAGMIESVKKTLIKLHVPRSRIPRPLRFMATSTPARAA